MKPKDAAASLEQLKKDLSGGELKRFYLLFGSERYLRNFYEKKLLKAMGGSRDDMNTSIFDMNPVQASSIIDAAQTMPFFADRRVVVVRYSGFFKKNSEELAEFFQDVIHVSLAVDQLDDIRSHAAHVEPFLGIFSFQVASLDVRVEFHILK